MRGAAEACAHAARLDNAGSCGRERLVRQRRGAALQRLREVVDAGPGASGAPLSAPGLLSKAVSHTLVKCAAPCHGERDAAALQRVLGRMSPGAVWGWLGAAFGLI